MRKYKDFIFDLYGTLVDIHTDEESSEVWSRFAVELSQYGLTCDPEELRLDYLSLVSEEEKRLKEKYAAFEEDPEIDIYNVFSRLFACKGVLADRQMIYQIGTSLRKLTTEYIRLYDGVPELLMKIKKAGGRVWLLSNAQRLYTARELDELGLVEYFDGIYLSSDYEVKKPDPRFFQKLLQSEGIDSENAIMIGNDGTCDIQGAKSVGLSTLYIRSNLSPKEPTPKSDYILDSMDMNRVSEILLSADLSSV